MEEFKLNDPKTGEYLHLRIDDNLYQQLASEIVWRNLRRFFHNKTAEKIAKTLDKIGYL